MVGVAVIVPIGLIVLCLVISSAVNGSNWHGFKKK